MKNLINNLFLFGLLGSIVFLYSCNGGDDEPVVMTPDPPSISLSVEGGTLSADQSMLTVEAGSSLTFSATVTAPGGFNRFFLVENNNTDPSADFSRRDLSLDAGATTAQISLNPFSYPTAGNALLTFTAVDDEGQTTEAVVNVTITSQPAEVRSQTLLAAPLGDNSSKTFYSVSNDALYSNNDVTGTADPLSAAIDFGYYYGASENASLASPSSYPTSIYDLTAIGWGTLNTTALATTTISASTFAELSSVADVEGQLENVDFSTAPALVTNLSEGDVLAFSTAGGVQGLIRVVTITGTFNAGDNIELELILAQEAGN